MCSSCVSISRSAKKNPLLQIAGLTFAIRTLSLSANLTNISDFFRSAEMMLEFVASRNNQLLMGHSGWPLSG